MARIIVVTSGKGGVGKTTVVANLGRQLASRGKKVLLMDADFGLNNLDINLGTEDEITFDLLDVLDGKCRIKQALVQDKNNKNLFSLSSDKMATDRYFSAQKIKAVIVALSRSFDFVLIDSPAGVDEGFVRAIAVADEGIIVTTPTLPALRDADKVINFMEGYR
ncbi:MAG: AAA family ATPase, partial [Clostridia bacterium]|nr:AAA family ATPase [Clostridia bacterium]